jgi:hypothetical protein
MLDSSPVVLPSSRPLKRSASTASLPTPPRTLDKKKTRARSRHSVQDTDSESNYSQSDSDGEKEVDRVSFGRKKRRTAVVLKGHDEEEHENEFWMGRSAGKKRKQVDADADDSDAPPALLQYRVKAPVSPPPSRRQTTAPEPPVTPQSAGSSRMLTRAARRQLLRDSPENPFLDDSPGSPASSPAPRTPTQHGEKELMTYVFRGMKAQFVNPFYNLPPSAHERSLLPVEHPDYEANEACPPKLLFPSARQHRRRRHSPELTNEGQPQRPPKKLVPKKGEKKVEKKKQELERTDSLRAGAVVGGKDDPLRRAQGPVRPTRR